jgi:deoxyinosine 3'endonuclease (endonuclease V)
MNAELRAVVIDAISQEIISSRVMHQDKQTMQYVIGLLEFRHRLMMEQLTDQAAETHRLMGIINHPPRDLTAEMAKEMP